MTTELKSGEFLVWCPDYGEDEHDARGTKASCPEEAAESWAEWQDRRSEDHKLTDGHSARVCVRLKGSDETRHYIVSGECVPCYRVTLVE